MAGQEFSQLPRILIAGRGSWPRRRFAVALPDDIVHPLMDLDTVGIAFPGTRTVEPAPASVWLPATSHDATASAVATTLRARFTSLPIVVVVELRRDGDAHPAVMANLAALAAALGRGGTNARVALGLRAGHLVGGRQHLAMLTALRRMAEEWEIGLAIDLTGAFDPQWEAEAAVVRLGARLVLVRAGSRVVGPGPVDRDRVARRALRAAIERCPDASVSLEPHAPWWRCFDADERGRAWLEAEDRLRRWFAPPTRDDETRPNSLGRRSSRQPFTPG